MDFYYRKLMGNGTMASKFRFSESVPTNQPISPTLQNATAPISPSLSGESHHSSNCVRCYKLKKKCSRTYPKCSYCARTGSSCEYVDRKAKKPKLMHTNPDPDVQTISEPPHPERLSQSSLSIASLVNREENEHVFQNVDLPKQTSSMERKPSSSSIERKHSSSSISSSSSSSSSLPTKPSSLHKKPVQELNHKILALSLHPPQKSNVMDEYLVVKPITEASLPTTFADYFFANFSWKYPLLDQASFTKKLSSVSFSTETFVTLDVYLVLAIGCNMFDSVNGTSHFREIFSEKMVKSVVDIVSYDLSGEDTKLRSTLLILLALYAINTYNVPLIWTIVGFLNRLIFANVDFSDLSRKSPLNCKSLSPRAFWCVFNLEKELSLLLTKPSQFIPDTLLDHSFDFAQCVKEGESDTLASLMGSEVQLHRLQNQLLDVKLGIVANTAEKRNEFSSELEKWRVQISRAVHVEFAELPFLLSVIAVVNVDYYYLSIELDQLSSTESFQFTLQFLLNSFSILLNEQSKSKQSSPGISLYQFFWFQKFFNVISFSLGSLGKLLQDNTISTSELCVKVSDFGSNLLLIINLAKYLTDGDKGETFYKEKLTKEIEKLTGLSTKLMGNNILTASDKEKEEIVDYVKQLLGH